MGLSYKAPGCVCDYVMTGRGLSQSLDGPCSSPAGPQGKAIGACRRASLSDPGLLSQSRGEKPSALGCVSVTKTDPEKQYEGEEEQEEEEVEEEDAQCKQSSTVFEIEDDRIAGYELQFFPVFQKSAF